MYFVEMLSRVEPGTSPFLAMMQNDKQKSARDLRIEKLAEKTNKCVGCRGKGIVKAPTPENPQKTTICEMCSGTKKMKVSAAGKQGRPKGAPPVLAIEQISFCAAGMPQHKLHAALTLACHRYDQKLVDDVLTRIVEPLSEEWGLSQSTKKIRALGLSRVVVAKMMMPRMSDPWMPTQTAAALMCCRDQEWRNRWYDRALPVHEKVRGWVTDADQYMLSRYYEIEEAA